MATPKKKQATKTKTSKTVSKTVSKTKPKTKTSVEKTKPASSSVTKPVTKPAVVNKPTKKNKVLLDPHWFVETCKLAKKYNTSLAFNGDRVWGVSYRYGMSVWANYPSDVEWCKEVARVFSNSVTFGGTHMVDLKKIGQYANLELDDTASAWIDEVKAVLYIKTKAKGGVTLKSGTFEEDDITAPSLPLNKMVDFVYSDEVSKQRHDLLIKCVSQDITRMSICRVFPYKFNDGSSKLVGTDGRSMMVVNFEDGVLPAQFNFDPNVVKATDIVGFYHGEDDNDSPSNYYQMNDNVILCEVQGETLNPPGSIEGIISGSLKNTCSTVSGETLKDVIRKIKKLGLIKGITSNTLTIDDKQITFNTEEGILFESEEEDLEVLDGTKTHLSLTLASLNTFASLGLDLNIAGTCPAFHSCDEFTYIVMPLRVS